MATNRFIKTKDYGLTVYVGEKGIDEALRRFKKRIEKAGVLEEVYERKYFVKPSAIKREKRKLAKRK